MNIPYGFLGKDLWITFSETIGPTQVMSQVKLFARRSEMVLHEVLFVALDGFTPCSFTMFLGRKGSPPH